MQLRRAAVAAVAVVVLLLSATTDAHNITRILAKYPDFSTFNRYLSETHLAEDINNRETITVCAVNNAGMADLLAKHLPISGIKDVLSLHVLLDYFDSKKLHQITNGTALAATMYQATGTAAGSSGFVNITDMKGGKVGFSPKDSDVIHATFVKSLDEIPYNISVIQISNVLPSTEALAPSPAPSQENLTAIMSSHGCKVFAETLLANPAQKTYEDAVDGGLTIFCPGDDAMKNFLPKYKNLTAAGKQALLEFHGMPIYQSLSGLKSSNGLTNSLATDGANKYDFTVQNDGTQVTLKTKLVTAKIVDTIIDKQPLAIFSLNKVLMPEELFKLAPTPAPAPAPEGDADAPAPSKRKHRSPPAPDSPSDSPADAPDGDAADQTADNNGAVGYNGGKFVAVILTLWFAYLQL